MQQKQIVSPFSLHVILSAIFVHSRPIYLKRRRIRVSYNCEMLHSAYSLLKTEQNWGSRVRRPLDSSGRRYGVATAKSRSLLSRIFIRRRMGAYRTSSNWPIGYTSRPYETGEVLPRISLAQGRTVSLANRSQILSDFPLSPLYSTSFSCALKFI